MHLLPFLQRALSSLSDVLLSNVAPSFLLISILVIEHPALSSDFHLARDPVLLIRLSFTHHCQRVGHSEGREVCLGQAVHQGKRGMTPHSLPKSPYFHLIHAFGIGG